MMNDIGAPSRVQNDESRKGPNLVHRINALAFDWNVMEGDACFTDHICRLSDGWGRDLDIIPGGSKAQREIEPVRNEEASVVHHHQHTRLPVLQQGFARRELHKTAIKSQFTLPPDQRSRMRNERPARHQEKAFTCQLLMPDEH